MANSDWVPKVLGEFIVLEKILHDSASDTGCKIGAQRGFIETLNLSTDADSSTNTKRTKKDRKFFFFLRGVQNKFFSVSALNLFLVVWGEGQ